MQRIKNITLAFVCITMGYALSSQTKPNIILFLVDDMGWQDCSVSFWDSPTKNNTIYETPHLEKLAANGVMFTNAYAHPVCTPTRISIMTGMNVARHGVTNWTNVHKDTPTDHPDELLSPAKWNYNGWSNEPTIPYSITATPLPLVLKNAGYYTIHCGKAHFAPYGVGGSDPTHLGFDLNIAGSAAGNPGSFLAEDAYGGLKGDTLWAIKGLTEHINKREFLTDALTAEAIHSMDLAKEKGKPFFLYMAHYAVHLPFSKDTRFFHKYIDKGLTETEAKYAALIEGMDKSLGEIMDHLKKIGAEQNTYIIFMSDNGGLSLAPPRTGGMHTQNQPLKKGKGSLYEGGIRIPFVLAGPGINKGDVSQQYLIAEDLFPTILDWAGIKHPQLIQKVDGKNIDPFVKNPNKIDQKKILLWHYPNNWTNINEHGISWSSAIRQGKWKMIYFHKDQKLELYNFIDDIQEEKDLSQREPQRLRKMASLMTKELKERNAQMPSYKNNNMSIAWPNELKEYFKNNQ